MRDLREKSRRRNRKKLQVAGIILMLGTLCNIILNLFHYTNLDWRFPKEHVMSRFSVNATYFVLLLLVTLVYVNLRVERKWSHVLGLALFPFFFMVIFCMNLGMGGILMVAAFALILTILDIWIEVAVGDFDLAVLVFEILPTMVIKVWLGICIVGGFLTVLLVLVGINGQIRAAQVDAIYEDMVFATNVRDFESTTSEDLWENNRENLKKLSIENYAALSLEEKLSALQELLNIEAQYLGVDPVPLAMTDLREGVLGEYDDVAELILIDSEVMQEDRAREAIGICLHEIYHCYAFHCVEEYEKMEKAGMDSELLFARDIKKWRSEFEDYYSSSKEDDDSDAVDQEKRYYRYRSQAIESSAEHYKNEWLDSYWAFINGWSSVVKDPLYREDHTTSEQLKDYLDGKFEA